jgi:molybdate transport system regulatory protein
MSKPETRVRVDFPGDCSIGPGKIALLEGIERSGSLSAAARQLGMSYRRAWLLLHNTNAAFHQPVVELAVGGKDGGGARLTTFGRQLVVDFRSFEEDVDQLAAQRFASLRVSGQPAPGQGISRTLREPKPVGRSRLAKASRNRHG